MSQNYTNLKIRSDEIILVALNTDYADEILKANTGNVRNYFITFETRKHVVEWIESDVELMERGQKIELVMLNGENDFLGLLSIRDISTKPMFGLWVTPSMQNKGYAKKGMELFVSWLFKYTNLNKLIYTVATKNTASVALAKSLNGKHIRDFMDEDGEDSGEFVFEKSSWQVRF